MATFLRRADRIDLHVAAVDEVEASYAEVFADLPGQVHLAVSAARRRNTRMVIGAGLIESVGHGLVDFAIPGLREHLHS